MDPLSNRLESLTETKLEDCRESPHNQGEEKAVDLVQEAMAYTTVENALLLRCQGRAYGQCGCGVVAEYRRADSLWVIRCAGDAAQGIDPCGWYVVSVENLYGAARACFLG